MHVHDHSADILGVSLFSSQPQFGRGFIWDIQIRLHYKDIHMYSLWVEIKVSIKIHQEVWSRVITPKTNILKVIEIQDVCVDLFQWLKQIWWDWFSTFHVTVLHRCESRPQLKQIKADTKRVYYVQSHVTNCRHLNMYLIKCCFELSFYEYKNLIFFLPSCISVAHIHVVQFVHDVSNIVRIDIQFFLIKSTERSYICFSL